MNEKIEREDLNDELRVDASIENAHEQSGRIRELELSLASVENKSNDNHSDIIELARKCEKF